MAEALDYQTERGRVLSEIFEPVRAGMPEDLVELSEQQVFPYLIPVSVGTGRNSRQSGRLLGRKAPAYIKHGRTVRYRLSDVLQWIRGGQRVASTAEFSIIPPRE